MQAVGALKALLAEEELIKKYLSSLFVIQLKKEFIRLDDLRASLGLSEAEAEEALKELEERAYIESATSAGKASKYVLTKRGRRGVTVVVTGGVFDVIHVGHVGALAEARKLGDLLVAVVATDRTVERMKGKPPVFPAEMRRALVESLKPVDAAILGYEELSFEQVIQDVMPDIVAVGHDQESVERSVKEIVESKRLPIKVVRLPKVQKVGLESSTDVKKKVVKEWR